MDNLIILVAVWFISWGIFAFKIRWLFNDYPNIKFAIRGLYFVLIFIFIYVYFYQFVNTYSLQLITATIISICVSLLIRYNKPFFIKGEKNKNFYFWQTFNVLFQQTMVLISILLLKTKYGEDYNDYYFGIIFLLGHLPVLLISWANLKSFYIFYSLFAGIIFSFLINNFRYGLVISFMLHYLAYILLVYRVKDEEKI